MKKRKGEGENIGKAAKESLERILCLWTGMLATEKKIVKPDVSNLETYT